MSCYIDLVFDALKLSDDFFSSQFLDLVLFFFILLFPASSYYLKSEHNIIFLYTSDCRIFPIFILFHVYLNIIKKGKKSIFLKDKGRSMLFLMKFKLVFSIFPFSFQHLLFSDTWTGQISILNNRVHCVLGLKLASNN